MTPHFFLSPSRVLSVPLLFLTDTVPHRLTVVVDGGGHCKRIRSGTGPRVWYKEKKTRYRVPGSTGPIQ